MKKQSCQKIIIPVIFIIVFLASNLLLEMNVSCAPQVPPKAFPIPESNGKIVYSTQNSESPTEESQELDIESPEPKYYDTSTVPIVLTSEETQFVSWNLSNGTHWLYSSHQEYTYPTQTNLANGEYQLQVWLENQPVKNVVFGVNTRNTGTVYAKGGSNSEIQAAVDSALTGYAVYIPAGTYAFDSASPWTPVKVPAGVSIYGAPALRDANGQVRDRNWSTVLIMPYDPTGWSVFFEYSGTSSYVTRFTGMKLVGYREFNSTHKTANCEAIRLTSGESEYRIDHCYFRNVPGTATVYAYGGGKGCVDHCVFIVNPASLTDAWDTDTTHYGICTIGYGGDSNTWLPLNSVVGKYNNRDWYVENNYFSGYSVPITTIAHGHYVFRYNIVDNQHGPSSHADDNGGGNGGRCAEVYSNIFNWKDLGSFSSYGAKINCGTLIATGNTFSNYGLGRTSYDAAIHLIQRNSDSAAWSQIQNSYIWGNILSPAGSDLLAIRYETGQNPIILDEDYFLRAPSTTLDGWTYIPYTYPHPLVD